MTKQTITQQTTNPPAEEGRLARVQAWLRVLELDMRLLGMIGALLTIWIGFHVLSDGVFITPRNLYNLAEQTSVVAIIATGMVLVIVTRNIDLSVGSLLGFLGMVMAFVQAEVFAVDVSWNWWVTLLIGLAVGALVGAFQGWWIAYQGVPAFIVTLAGLLIFRGGAWLVTQGRTVAPLNSTFQLLGGGLAGSIGAFWSWVLGLVGIALLIANRLFTRQRRQRLGFPNKPLWAELITTGAIVALVLAFVMVMNAYMRPRSDIPRGIPVPVLIMLGIAVIMSALVRLTKFGRYVFALGGNPEAAKLAGINTKLVTLMIFVIMGMLCAVAGAVASARLNAGANATGTLTELYVIAATVIGGTSLAGGAGTIIGAILGAVVMQSLQSGMVLLGVQSPLQQVIVGFVLIVAVWIDTRYRRGTGLSDD
jgi:D-xylose transport system permease protein